MEKSDNSRDECSQCTPSRTLHALRQALLDSKAENKQQAAENAALREQIASKELSCEQEKKKLLDERDSLVSTLFMAKNDMDDLVKALESIRASQKQFYTQRTHLERQMKKNEEEVRSLKESLRCQQMETEEVKKSWKAECDKFNEMKLSFDKTVIQINADWESRWIIRQEEVAAELKTLQQDCEKKASQVIQDKDDVITSVRKEMMALVEGNLAKLRTVQMEIHQSETEWQTKHKALEDRLRCELAAKEESFKKTQELQKDSREMEEKWLAREEEWLNKEEEWLAKEEECLNKEEKWLAKEEEWLNKASKMEEEMKLLIQQNVELQELASKTDKEKAKMKKEEKKATKETEKRLKRERKEEEEREKKEKEANEKKEKERLKREKKEKEEREKKAKKERKEREKREKKEKEANEKKEKERLNREKKEKEEREKKAKKERKEIEK